MRLVIVRASFGSIARVEQSMSPRRDRRASLEVELMEARTLLSGFSAGSSARRTFNPQPDPPTVMAPVKLGGHVGNVVLHPVAVNHIVDANQSISVHWYEDPNE